MARFRNVSGNDLFVVAASKLVEDDAVFEVPDDQADGFECQPTNYERISDASSKKKSDKESE